MSPFAKHFRKYAKGYVAVAMAVTTTVKAVIADGITADEWTTVVIAAIGAIGVLLVPNAKIKEAKESNDDSAIEGPA